MTQKANWWIRKGKKIKCILCPKLCLLSPGETGLCGVRKNESDVLSLPGYGMVTAEAQDPIEKKPLFHFYPGETAWSIGFAGCNLRCPFCQNHSIARANPNSGRFTAPSRVIDDAVSSAAKIIAYTYSEPTIHFEYLMECAYRASNAGLKNVLVTNGNLNSKPALELLKRMDGVNVDLKSWSSEYYKETLGGDLKTVKKFIENALAHCWVEITTLVVPGDNDDEDEIESISEWITSLSADIPFHLSAYHPAYKYSRPATSSSKLKRVYDAASKKLHFVYIGNLGIENCTQCPNCNHPLISRSSYRVKSVMLGEKCPNCGLKIPGVFK